MTALSEHAVGASVDPALWPDVAIVPHRPLRARIAHGLFEHAVRRLRLTVLLPDGRVLGRGGPVMTVRRPAALESRVGASGLVGFGEAYMAGDWDSDDLAGVLTVFAASVATVVPPWLQRFRRIAVLTQPSSERNSPPNSRRNVSRHYDLSNEMFELFLDETMTYSSALFDGGTPTWSDLAAGQRRKIDRLLDGAGVRAGSELLEIGTGWGELALRAAARGAHVTSLTLSSEQKELAERRIAAAGLADHATVVLRDYREQEGTFDAVVSVEMIEAVGFDYWPVYFGTIDRLLRPSGRVALQAITMPHDRMMASRNTYTWIHKYIFPGGIIPSTRSIEDNVRAGTSMRVVDRFAMGPDYAATLRLWRGQFEAHAADVCALGFDETFRRMWSLYLAYSEAGFRSGYLDVHQYVLAKG
ncbi:MAG TPA: cyclopropane-fatty-acyl-phospholipid synthase family protein [Mycobacteriales bacterium]